MLKPLKRSIGLKAIQALAAPASSIAADRKMRTLVP